MVLKIRENYICKKIKNEYVMLNTDTCEYYGLNEVGSRFLELVDGKSDFEKILDVIEEEYDAERSVLKRDFEKLVLEMKQNGILEII